MYTYVYLWRSNYRYVFGSLTLSVAEVLILFGLTCHLLSNLQFESMQYFHVCMTIMMSNMCIWTSTCHYSCLLLFLNMRFFYLNSILRQLLFDQPMDDLVFVTKRGMRKQLPIASKPKAKTHSISGGVGPNEAYTNTADREEEYAFTMGLKNLIEMCTKT